MKKCYIIILLLIGFNCKDEMIPPDGREEGSSPEKIFSYSIYKNITDMTSYCLRYESKCLNKLKDGLSLIERMLNISYDNNFLQQLKLTILRYDQQISKTYVELSKSILSKFPEKFRIENLEPICKSIECTKTNIMCGPCLKEGENFRKLYLFGLINKETICIYLMSFIGAEIENCYD